MTEERGSDGRGRRLRRRQQLGRTGARFPRIADPEEPADPPADPTDDAMHEATADAPRGRVPRDPEGGDATGPDPASGTDPMIGRTGARFGSRARQVRRTREQQAADDAVVPVQAAPVRPGPGPDDAPTAPLHLAELRDRADGVEPRVSVRPYVRTRGRTRSRPDLLVETLISLPSPRPPLEDPEHVVIGGLCEQAPRSVAEVAALMQVPLGVARVLIGDMADGGTVRIHPTAAAGSQRGPDREVMARVLRGLHRL